MNNQSNPLNNETKNDSKTQNNVTPQIPSMPINNPNQKVQISSNNKEINQIPPKPTKLMEKTIHQTLTPYEKQLIVGNDNLKKNNPSKNKLENTNKKSSKNKILIAFLIILVALTVGLYMGKDFIAGKITKKAPVVNNNQNNKVIQTKGYCDNVSLKYFLEHFNLKEENITIVNNDNTSKYYAVYNGYIFTKDEYTINIKDDKVVCELNNIKTTDLPTLEELKTKYEKLTSNELKSQLLKETNARFKMFNLIPSLTEVTAYIKKCELTDNEINEQLLDIENNYEKYIETKPENEKIIYSKDELYNAIFESKF